MDLANEHNFTKLKPSKCHIDITNLTWPGPLHIGAYQLEIISAALRGSGTVHSTKKFNT